MKELLESTVESIKHRLTNALYGTFVISWMIFHWNFLFALFFLDDGMIFNQSHLLKNDYLVEKYFNLYSWYFWFSWTMPLVITYIVIWQLPRLLLLRAHDKNEKYEADKKIIEISHKKRMEQEMVKLEEQTAKKITAVAKQAVEEKKIKEINPSSGWNIDYLRFKSLSLFYKFPKIIESYYKRSGDITVTDNFGQHTVFEIPQDILAYAHSNGLIEIDNNKKKINMTDKGKYFINKSLEENK